MSAPSAAPAVVTGLRLRLRLITPDDAEYVYGLRTDPALNAHLSEVRGTIEDQRRWIEAYKAREADGSELYYVIERLADARRCGVVRLYDIEQDRFTWGSWILDSNKPPKAALESAVLSFGVGFEVLGCAVAHIDVRRENAKALALYRRFGATETHADEQDISFTYSRARFLADRPGHLAMLSGGTVP